MSRKHPFHGFYPLSIMQLGGQCISIYCITDHNCQKYLQGQQRHVGLYHMIAFGQINMELSLQNIMQGNIFVKNRLGQSYIMRVGLWGTQAVDIVHAHIYLLDIIGITYDKIRWGFDYYKGVDQSKIIGNVLDDDVDQYSKTMKSYHVLELRLR